MDQHNPYTVAHPYGCSCTSCHNHIITEPMFDNGTKPIGTTIDISPPDMFFGSKGIGEPVPTQKVTVTNNSPSAIRILDISLTDTTNFKFGDGFIAPSVIQPGASFDVPVEYMALDIGQSVGQVIIDTDEDRLNYSVGLSGRVISQSGGGGGSGGNGYDDTALRNFVNQSLIAQKNDYTALITDQRWATADDLGAEAGYRLTLAATLRDEIEARVMVEYIARVNQYEAEATARLELTARFNENVATVTESFRVYANQFSAEAYARLELEALVEENQARFEESKTVIATQFSAEATARSELEARVSNYSDSLIEEERVARATQLASEASARQTLQTNFETLVSNANTRISNEVQARTDALSALAQRVSTIEANYTSGGEGGDGVDTVARAMVRDEASARSDADSSLASRIQTVESTYQTAEMVGQIASALVQAESTARTNAIQAEATQRETLAAALGTANANIAAEVIARANAIEAVSGRVDVLSATYTTSANWVPDSEFTDIRNWKMSSNLLNGTQSINGSGEFWRPKDQNVMTLASGVPVYENGYMELVSEAIPVIAGEYVQFYMMSASHRATNWCTLIFYNPDGANIAYAGEYMSDRIDNGGRNPSQWDQTGSTSFKVPDGAVFCRLVLRKYDTIYDNTDSVAWFWRPYVGPARQGQTTWNPYTPGTFKDTFALTAARISQVDTARATADEAFAGQLNTITTEYRSLDSGTKALIAAETTARSTALAAEATSRQTLEASFGRLPEMWRIVARGNAAPLPTNALEASIYGPLGHRYGAYSRSYTVFYFKDGQNVLEDGKAFDVFGLGEVLYNPGGSGANNAQAMAAYLDNIPEGRTVFIYTADEPSRFRHHDGLLEAMRRCGSGEMFDSEQFRERSAYILVGRAGAGRGKGMEYYAGNNDNSNQAYLDIVVPMVAGRASIGGQANAAVTSSRLTDEIIVRAAADGALSSRISTIEANYISTAGATTIAAAKVAEEATARANALGALATTVNTIDANWQQANLDRYNQGIAVDGRITTEESVRAGADGAISTRIDSIISDYQGRDVTTNVRINAEEIARAGADGALGTRISTIDSDYKSAVSAVDARVTSEETARATADGALAGSINSVSATANGASSTASAALTAAQSADGKLANARVEFIANTAGGRVGLTLRSDVNAGAGIDLEGDVMFKGSLNVGPDSGERTKIVNQGVRVYDTNGTMRVRLGIW